MLPASWIVRAVLASCVLVLAVLAINITRGPGAVRSIELSKAAASPALAGSSSIAAVRATATPVKPATSTWDNALAESDPQRRAAALLQIARQSALADVQHLLTRASSLNDEQLRFELRRILLVRLARVNALEAIACARQLPESERVSDLVSAALEAWAIVDPKSALHWFALPENASGDAGAVSALAAGLKDHAPERLLETMASIGKQTTRDALSAALVDIWKDSSPRAAAVFVKEATTGPLLNDLLGRIMPEWGKSDLAGAVQWVRELPAGPAQTAALNHLAYSWAETSPREAADFGRALPAGNEQFVTTLVAHWARQDQAAAIEWAQQLPDGATKERVLTALAATLAQTNPRAAAEFAQRLPPGSTQWEATISAVSAWAAREPVVVAEWVASFPEGRQRQYAIENVFYTWIETDPVAAVAWLQRLPNGADRDTALHAGAGRLVTTHPDLSAQLAVGIADEALRQQQTERAVRAWLAADRTAASAWLAQSNLPSVLKQQLLPEPTR